jgi:hypothetical protein
MAFEVFSARFRNFMAFEVFWASFKSFMAFEVFFEEALIHLQQTLEA